MREIVLEEYRRYLELKEVSRPYLEQLRALLPKKRKESSATMNQTPLGDWFISQGERKYSSSLNSIERAFDNIREAIGDYRGGLRRVAETPSIRERYIEASIRAVRWRADEGFSGSRNPLHNIFRDPKMPVGWQGPVNTKDFNVRPSFEKRKGLFDGVVDAVCILDIDECIKKDDYLSAKVIGFKQTRTSGTWKITQAAGYVAKHEGFGINAFSEVGRERAIKTCESRVLKHIDNKIKGV